MAIHQPPQPSGEPPYTLAQFASPPTRRRRTPAAIAVVITALTAVLAGATLGVRAIWPDAPLIGRSTFNVSGSIVLMRSDGYSSDGRDCSGRRGYDDIHAGAQVTVTDQAGTVVALSELQPGHQSGEAGGCLFLFTVRDVPKGKGFYGVSVGRETRGTVRYSEKNLRTGPRLVLANS